MSKTKYVQIDGITGIISVLLPLELEIYSNELNRDIMEEFAFDGLNKNNTEIINNFVIDWFKEKNIILQN